jgi:hypothetical protein
MSLKNSNSLFNNFDLLRNNSKIKISDKSGTLNYLNNGNKIRPPSANNNLFLFDNYKKDNFKLKSAKHDHSYSKVSVYDKIISTSDNGNGLSQSKSNFGKRYNEILKEFGTGESVNKNSRGVLGLNLNLNPNSNLKARNNISTKSRENLERLKINVSVKKLEGETFSPLNEMMLGLIKNTPNKVSFNNKKAMDNEKAFGSMFERQKSKFLKQDLTK